MERTDVWKQELLEFYPHPAIQSFMGKDGVILSGSYGTVPPMPGMCSFS